MLKLVNVYEVNPCVYITKMKEYQYEDNRRALEKQQKVCAIYM